MHNILRAAVLGTSMISSGWAFASDKSEVANLSEEEQRMQELTNMAIQGNKLSKRLCLTAICRATFDAATAAMEANQQDRRNRNKQLESD